MTYTITRNTSAAEKPPVPPINPDTGEAYPMMAEYSNGWLHCYCEDVEEAVAAIIGDPAYLDEPDEQARLIARVKKAMRISCVIQAEQVHAATLDGRWPALSPEEQAMLLSVRIRQPAGLHTELFGVPAWTPLAPVPLVVVSTGYSPWVEQPMPLGSPEQVWVIDPLTSDDFLSSLADIGAIRIFMRDLDG